MHVSLECQKRPEGSKPRALRREGLIPAVLYGHSGTESLSLTIPAKEAINLLKKASINNTLVDLNVPDVPWNGTALIREVQAHPWKRTLFHLSFFSVDAGQKLEIDVPVRLVGESIGVKQGGILEQMITDVKVQCTPKFIPESIDVDISDKAIGTSISVGDLTLPEGVVVLDDVSQMIFSIAAPAKEKTSLDDDEDGLGGEDI